MPPAPFPDNEPQRLRAVHAHGLTECRRADWADRLARAAARAAGCPTALISVITRNEQRFIGSAGFHADRTPRDHAFCARTILDTEPLITRDATRDPRFADNPLVTGEPHIRFYAGIPLIDDAGYALGTLCVIDSNPRDPDAETLHALRDLAAAATHGLTASRTANRTARDALKQRAIAAILDTEKSQLVDENNALRLIHASVERSGEAIYWLDAAGNIRFANQRASEMLGYSPAEFLTLTTRELGGERWPEHRFRELIQQIRENGPQRIETDQFRKDGSSIPVEIDCSIIDANNETYMCAFARDISDRRTRDAERKLMQERLDLALTAANQGLWDWDIQTNQIYFNDTYFTMLGYRPNELPSNLDTWIELCNPEDLPHALDNVRAHHEGRTDTYQAEFRLRRKDGSDQWILATGRVIERDSSGKPVRMIGTHVDIHHQRLARQAALDADRAKSQFLANMSHEVRTPLSAILGFTDLILEPDATPEQRADHARTIQRNARHLLQLINDVLDISRIEAGRLVLQHTDADPRDIAQDALELVRPGAEEKRINLAINHAAQLPPAIRTDPLRLRQILINLLANAVKFTGEHGTVTLDITQRGNTLAFAVQDTGIGLTQPQIDALKKFHPFTQADASTTRRFGGSGLGLCICNALAKRLHGRLDIASTPGQGSTFTLTLRLDNAETAQPQPTRPPRQLPAPHATQPDTTDLTAARILLAEDGPDNQRLISHHLTKAGAAVTLAATGREALKAIERQPPDKPFHLLLLDMQMPDLDGYQTARTLRRRNDTIPIVALTAHAMPQDRERCLDAGCDDYLAKPVDRETLLHTCLHHLRPTHQERHAA